MILKQYYLGCLAHASYLVADRKSGAAAVIDPQRDIDGYLADARELDLEIGHVILTHFHADFVAGHLELRDRCGAEIAVGARGTADYPFRPLETGATIELGPDVRLEVLETPGHSPESISILVHDAGHDETAPYAVLTGDTLFIGDVGRPDLRAALGWTAEELGGLLYDSLRERLLPLPDATLVYPTHGAGSLCGKSISSETVSTIGEQRRYNYALQPMTKETFVRIVTADQPDSPAYFTYDAVMNTRERPTLDASLERSLRPLDLAELLDLGAAGAQIVDAREPADFAGAHLASALNIGLAGSFATWCGTLLDPGRSIALVVDPGREVEAVTRLGRIGFERIAGYLALGMTALEPRPDLVVRTERISATALAERLGPGGEQPLVLDVRTEPEWGGARIAGSLNVPLNRLPGRIGELPADRQIAVHCQTDYRASIAASLLEHHGFGNVTALVGGMEAWEASRLERAESA